MAATGKHNEPEILRGLVPYIFPAEIPPEPTETEETTTQPASTSELERLGVRSLADILRDPRALESPIEVVPRLAWAGRVTLLAAPEKCGKSTLATAAAAAVTRGSGFLGAKCPGGAVLWASFDREHISDLARRMLRFDVQAERLFLSEVQREPLETLENAASALRPRMVVVDTLATLGEALGLTDASSSAAWSPIMKALTRIAREMEPAVLLLHHSRRSDGAYRDSSAIGAGVDAILEMATDAKDATVRQLKGKGRFSIPATSLRLSGDAYELLDGAVPLPVRIVDFVRSNPGSSLRRAREATSGRSEEISAAIRSLVAEGRLENRASGPAMSLYVPEKDTTRGTMGEE